MEILLVRHGQPRWTHDGVAYNDPPLTDLGHQQAERMAERVVALGRVDEVCTSPMLRAQETAAPLLERLGIEPAVHGWLREIGLPDDWDGAPIDRIRSTFAAGRSRPREQWWDPVAPGAEAFRDFHRRVHAGTADLLDHLGIAPHPDDPEAVWAVPEADERRVVIVAHAGTNSLVLGRLLGLSPEPWEWERFRSAHASVSMVGTVDIGPGTIFSIHRFSGVGHLADLDVTY